jgi:hypothetical protein
MKRIHWILFVVLLALSLPGSILAQGSDPSREPMASTNYTIEWSALEEGHGGQATSDNFRMESAMIGQKFAKSDSTSDEYGLCTGFACVPQVDYRIFLPLVLRL